MHFQVKNTLKSNIYRTLKQALNLDFNNPDSVRTLPL